MIENPEDQKVIEQTISVMKTIAPQFVDTIGKLRALLPPEEKRIGGLAIPNWKMLAENNDDVLVEVSGNNGASWTTRYLKEINEDGRFVCWSDGHTSKTTQASNAWNQCRLIEDTRIRENPGYQPVPDGVEVEVMMRSGLKCTNLAVDFSWRIEDVSCDIITYRILGVKGN